MLSSNVINLYKHRGGVNMAGIYIETGALRKLLDYNHESNVYTSIFVLFELISGISNNDEFVYRKACIKRIFEQQLIIKPKMVDQLICDFMGSDNYRNDFSTTVLRIAKDITMLNTFNEYKNLKITFTYDKPILHCKNTSVHSWLEDWDEKISNLIKTSGNMFAESKDFIKRLFEEKGVRGLSQYYWNLYEENRFNENRISSISTFVSENQAEKVKESIDLVFSQYSFRLFFTAQAVIFSKAKYIHGGTQDKNNPSDLLHLLYLEGGDSIVSSDGIYDIIAEALTDDFRLIKITNQKSLHELLG